MLLGAFATGGCGAAPGLMLSNESTEPVDPLQFELVARFVHISDAQIIDEESPGRLASFAVATRSAWRPYEAYSTQLLDGMVRTINKIHVARHPIDFVVHTGDAADNAQRNELAWFIGVMDGGEIAPTSGVDDRPIDSRPPIHLDPHHAFVAQGLYRQGVHGPSSTILWFSVLGNHDRFAVGVFPIVTTLSGGRVSPMPVQNRIPLTLPILLDPSGSLAWGIVSPQNPGPPPTINLPMGVQPNPDRRYITTTEFVQAHLESVGEPHGHGFGDTGNPSSWYSVSVKPGLRLIALNSSTPIFERPASIYSEGAISMEQVWFLRSELDRAGQRGEIVIVATHHPSSDLDPSLGTALEAASFRSLLSEYPCVKLHLSGHRHENTVVDRGGYTEIITGSTLDAPQRGRVIELWRERDSADSSNGLISSIQVELRYYLFSHLDEIASTDDAQAALFDDPLREMRQIAAELAGAPLR